MTLTDFIAGKYGISHAVITLITLAAGALIGWGLATPLGLPAPLATTGGILWTAGASAGAWIAREAAQHYSWNPRRWTTDGLWDAGLPTALAVIATGAASIYLALWWPQ